MLANEDILELSKILVLSTLQTNIHCRLRHVYKSLASK